MANDNSDVEPPGLSGPPTISPSLARAGQTVEIAFRVDEVLEGSPVLVLQFSDGTLSAALEVQPISGTSDEYRARWPATGAEPEGVVRALAGMLDPSGNESARLDLGAFRLDFTPPSIVAGSETLVLTAGPSSPLAAVTALGSSSSATLGFTVSEALRGPPELSAERDGGSAGVSFVYSLGATVTYAWTASVPPTGAAQGPVQVVATLEDLAGNVSRQTVSLPLPGLVVDTVAPQPPRAADGGLMLDRAPWGSAAVGEVASATLRAGNGALEPGTLALITEKDLTRELGRAQTQDAGAFTFAVPIDALELYVAAVDAAGNRSPATQVRAGQLVASLGAVSGNPSRYDSREVLSPALLQSDAVARDSSAGLFAVGGASLATSGAWSWRRRDGASPPGALFTPFAWDEAAGRGLALGGQRGGVPVTGTASLWTGESWQAAASSDPESDGDPVALVGGGAARAMAHDPVRRETLLVVDAAGGLETWVWNGASWARKSKTAGGPTCNECQLVWAEALGAVVLLDHLSAVALYVWNAAAARWDALDAGALVPSGRPGSSAVEDGRSGGLLLLGGATDAGPTAELWAWAPQGWSQPAHDGGPGPALGRASTWDERLNRAVFAGGFAAEPDGGWRALDEVWEFNGTFSAAVRDDGGTALALGGASMVYDRAREQRVLVGGATQPLALPQSATWVWRYGVGWGQASAPGSPLPRAGHAAVYEPASRATYVFGGRTGDSFVNGYRDLWRWDGAGWTWIDALLPGPVGPDARFRAVLAARGNGEIVLHGGVATSLSCLGDTWALRAGKWAALPASSARCGHVAAWDSRSDRLVVSGGATQASAATAEAPGNFLASSEELAFDGGWQTADAGTFNLYGAAFAVDAAGTNGLTHGGARASGIVRETWRFDGDRWAQVTPAVPGPLVANASMAHDARSGNFVLFGGNLPGDSAELWVWNGSGWKQPALSDPEGDGAPAARSRASLTCDAARDVVTLFGGLSNGAMLGDTWELSMRGRPGQVFRTPLSSLGVSAVTLTSVELRGVAGASGQGGDGIEVLIWARGAWRFVPALDSSGGAHAAPASSPSRFTARLEDPAMLAWLRARPELALALAPRNGSGLAAPSMSVDQVELEIRYELTK